MKAKSEIKYISRAGLKGKRGWTDLLIRTFLKEPDLVTDNPHYKSAAPMHLWLISKVDAVEQTSEFKVMKREAWIRKQRSAKGIDTLRKRIIGYVQALKIVVPEYTKEQLEKAACESYNAHRGWIAYERGSEFEPASPDSDSDFLNRICVNFLRHRCKNYEQGLQRIFGKVASQQAHDILKERVNQAITDKYTFLYQPEMIC